MTNDQTIAGALLRDMSAAGRIEMRDRDRAALLHRLSTNDIERLRPGQGTRSVITNHNGRIIDLLTVYALDDSLLLITSPQQRAGVFSLLRKNIFFNDKVKLADASAVLGQLALYGSHAAALLAELGAGSVADLPLHGHMAVQVAGISARVARLLPLGGGGFTLLAPAENVAALQDALLAAGASTLDDATFEVLRVEAGYPAYGSELSLDYIPLESGLRDAISFNKGCYVGQEIIARMDSRNRMAKRLMGLRLSGPLEGPLPTKLEVAGKESGDLTSLVLSPQLGPIALAYVRSAYAEPGANVGIAGSDVQAEVVELPFV